MGSGSARRTVFAAAMALAAIAGSAIAEAASITQSLDYSFDNDHRTIVAGPNGTTSASNTQISRTLVFDQFDASLGELQAIGFSISAGGTRIVAVTHNAGGSGTVTVNITNTFGFILGDHLAEGAGSMGLQRSLPAWDLSTGQLYVGGTQNLDVMAAVNKTVSFDAAQFASFIGSGTLDLLIYSLNVFESLGATGDGLIATAIAGSCNPNCGNFAWAGPIFGSASLTYTYREMAQVPEPGTFALMAAGLAGLGLARRKARRAA